VTISGWRMELPRRTSRHIPKGGLLVDHYTHNDGHFTGQEDAQVGNPGDHHGDLYGFKLLWRWTQRISERSSFEVQSDFG
jgi:hypothetical protein